MPGMWHKIYKIKSSLCRLNCYFNARFIYYYPWSSIHIITGCHPYGDSKNPIAEHQIQIQKILSVSQIRGIYEKKYRDNKNQINDRDKRVVIQEIGNRGQIRIKDNTGNNTE